MIPSRSVLTPLTVAVIWGINVPVMKAGLAEIDPFVFNALRLTLSAIALGLVDRIERGGAPAPPIRWSTVLWFGFLSSFAYQLLFLWGMDNTSAGNTALIIASGPLWTAVLSALYRVDRPTWSAVVSLCIAFLGTLLVTTSGAPSAAASDGFLLGNIAVLASMVTWAWATVLSRPILESFPATRLAYLATAVSLPGHWLIAGPRLTAIETSRPAFLGAVIVYSGVLSTGVAYALWNRSVKNLGPARTATFSYLVPVIALAVAWIFLHEKPTTVQVIGGALVIGGLSRSRSRRRRSPEALRPSPDRQNPSA